MQDSPHIKSTRTININIIILVLMMLFILLPALTIIQQIGGQVDDDGFPTIETWLSIPSMPWSPGDSLPLQLTLGVAVLSMLAEYFRSHIGEKRLGDWTIEFKNLFLIPDSPVTALFKAVICFYVPCFAKSMCID